MSILKVIPYSEDHHKGGQYSELQQNDTKIARQVGQAMLRRGTAREKWLAEKNRQWCQDR